MINEFDTIKEMIKAINQIIVPDKKATNIFRLHDMLLHPLPKPKRVIEEVDLSEVKEVRERLRAYNQKTRTKDMGLI